MIKKAGYIILLLSFLLIISCGDKDLLSPNDIPGPVTKPTSLTIRQTSLSACLLTWQDKADGEAGYQISRKKAGEAWVEDYAILAENSQEFNDLGLDMWINYAYRVATFHEEEFSDFAESNITLVTETFVYVPGGSFTMGRTRGNGRPNELPRHLVILSPFMIGKYEVTQAEYLTVMDTNPSYFRASDKPVERVTWFGAVQYCNALSIQEGLTPCYNISDWACDFSANGYRLPTEAEWEYAARGATKNPDYLYSGSDEIGSVAWYDGNMEEYGTKAVGMKAPNALGIYDMSGNVFEWCNDWYSTYDKATQTDPVGPAEGTDRILRGGTWLDSAAMARVAKRAYMKPEEGFYKGGFRVVRSLE